MKWIVTGGCGFIGTNAAVHLQKAGHEVVVLDNLHRPSVDRNLSMLRDQHDIECHVTDIRDDHALRGVWRQHANADVVLHLAGQVSLLASINDPRTDLEVNVIGTFNVLSATRDLIPEAAVLFASSNKVYGDLAEVRFKEESMRWVAPDYPNGMPESLPLDFHGGYGCSKGAADQYVLDFHRTYGLRGVTLRQSSTYGSLQFATHDQGWLAYFAQMGVLGERFTINGSGKQVRDALFVEDLVACYQAVASSIDRCAGQAYNVGGGPINTSSLLELFELLRSEHHLAIDYDHGPGRPGDQLVFVADNTKISQHTGWEPRTPLTEGLEHMIEWTRRAFRSPA